MTPIRMAAFALIFLLFLPTLGEARYDTSWRWRTLSNDHFTIYYPEGHEAFAQRVFALSDEVYEDVTGYLGVTPRHCPVVLNPGTDRFNAFFAPFPNRISLYETPNYKLNGFGPGSDSLDETFTHEFTHFVHLTARSGWYGALTRVLGDGAALSNTLSPGWVVEGLTTHAETLFSDGGRGRSELFRGVMGSAAEDGLWSLSSAGAHPIYSPPPGRIYLAGYHMIDYLAKTWGSDAVSRLVKYQALHPVGGIRQALIQVTGQYPDQFYDGFKVYYEKELSAMRERAARIGLVAGRSLTHEALESFDTHAWAEGGTIYAMRRGYDKLSALVAISPDTGTIISETPLGTLVNLAPLRLMEGDGKVLVSNPFPKPLGRGILDTVDLVLFDISSGGYKRLTHGGGLFSASPAPDGSGYVAVKRRGMWSELVLLPPDGTVNRVLYSKLGVTFEAPVWSPGGDVIAVTMKSGGNSDIVMVSPDTGAIRPLVGSDRYQDSDPSFSPDGAWVLFSSDRGGTWNIYGYHRSSSRFVQLTGAVFGAFEPRVSPDGRWLSYTRVKGGIKELAIRPFDAETGINRPLPEPTPIPEPDSGRLMPETFVQSKGLPIKEAYTPFLHIPFFSKDEEGSVLGVFLVGGDPVGLNRYQGSVFYGLESHRPGFDMTVVNASLTPDLGIRFYDSAEEGNSVAGLERWQRERLADIFATLPVIVQSLPSVMDTTVTLGLRRREFTGLRNVTLNPEKDEAVSAYGEFRIRRRPDAPVRDVLTTWGQELYAFYEKSGQEAGGELVSRNAVVSLTQNLPGPLAHDGISITAVHQAQSGELAYTKGRSLPRGYSSDDTKGGMNLDHNLLVSLEYHKPIAFPDDGFGLILYHVSRVKGSLFADYGGGWRDAFSARRWVDDGRLSVGGTLTADATVFAVLPLEVGLEAGYRPSDQDGFFNVITRITL